MQEDTPNKITLAPQPGMQEAVVRSTAYELLMGGQAGPGKTWTLLFDDIPDLLDPDMGSLRILYLRREYVDLGDMIDKAQQMWMPLGAKYASADSQYGKKTTFTWPNGAKCVFSHMQHEKDKFQFQGFEFQRVRFDEVAQFSETQYLYLFSRIRAPRVPGAKKIWMNIRSSCNPQGIGMLWVKRRFVDKLAPYETKYFIRDNKGRDTEVPKNTPLARSRTWIPGDRSENNYLDEEYEANLRQLTSEDYRALGLGIWEISDQPSQLVEVAWWNKALEGGTPEAISSDNTETSLSRYAIGADYAHEGKDSSVLCWGQGPKVIGMEERYRTRTEHFAQWVSALAHKLGIQQVDVGADGIGPGVGACDMMERGGKFINDFGVWEQIEAIPRLNRMVHKDPAFDLKYKGAYKFNNLRSQMWWRFREDMERGRVDLSWFSSEECDYEGVGELHEEVLAHTFESNNGVIEITSKKDLRRADSLGRSPDRADSLVIWNWVRQRDLEGEKEKMQKRLEAPEEEFVLSLEDNSHLLGDGSSLF